MKYLRPRSVAVWLCFAVVIVSALAVVGCTKAPSAKGPDGVSLAGAENANGGGVSRIRHAEGSAFPAGLTKVASAEAAEKVAGVAVVAPAETLGRTIAGVYVLSQDAAQDSSSASSGGAVLDYGDFRVNFERQADTKSSSAALSTVLYPGGRPSDLSTSVTVRGFSGVAVEKGETKLEVDSEGKLVRPGVTNAASWVLWPQGNVVLSVSSESMSTAELLAIASSIDF